MVAFITTLLAILALRPVAISIDLVDRPGGRKTHHGNVPLVGGLGIFLGVVVAVGLSEPLWHEAGPLLAVYGLMVVTGMLDDRYGLSHWMRLAVHIVAGTTLIITTGVLVRYLGNPFGLGEITLSYSVAVLFTIAMITAAVNSFNMLDGMDGLAGLNSLVSLGGLGWLAWKSGQGDTELAVCALLGSAILAFMVFNAPLLANRRLRCFMGDAGSTLIGVAIAWLCASISQMPLGGKPHPTYVLWMVALPLFELWWTFLRRVGRGHSPFHADAGHFHHMLINAGLSVRAAFVAFLLLDLLLVATAIAMATFQVPGWVAFASLVVAGVLVVRSFYVVHHVVRWLPMSRRTLQKLSGA